MTRELQRSRNPGCASTRPIEWARQPADNRQCKGEATMKASVIAAAVLVASTIPGIACAQYPGEPKRPRYEDSVDEMRWRFERGAPHEMIRKAQEALRDRGYYKGP